MCSEEVLEEIEALTAILEEDTVEVIKDGDTVRELNVGLTPLTASEQDKQYVSLTLVITITPEYPCKPPGLSVRNPRGLDETAVATLLDAMNARCEEYMDCPVFFELIELGREFLTERNVPVCQCIICLNTIQEEDVFMKTECLHFFHKHCLGRYITNMQKDYEKECKEAAAERKHSTLKEFEVTCPVCRDNIPQSKYDLSDLLSSPPPVASSGDLKVSIGSEVRKLQRDMQKLFLKQKEKGGIIDLEEEGRKYLVLTGSNDSESLQELSPTDYPSDEPVPMLGSPRHKSSKSTPTSLSPQDSPSHVPVYTQYRGRGGRGRGARQTQRRGGGKQQNEYHQPPQRGKSHHQQKKSKKEVRGGAAAGEGRGTDRSGAL